MKAFRDRHLKITSIFRKRRYALATITTIEGKSVRCGNEACGREFVDCRGGIKPAWSQVHTTFRSATYYSCGHNTPEVLCSTCEMDAVLRITKQEWKCPKKGCETGVLKIREEYVKKILLEDGKPSTVLFEDFITFINTSLCRCIICSDTIAPGITNPLPTRKCNHLNCVCKGCMKEMVSAQVSGDDWQNIRCPELECRKILEEEDIAIFASKETMQKYQERLSHRALERMPEFMWCPAAECDSGQLHAGMAKDSRFDCVGCKKSSCFGCKNVWHGSRTCEEAAREATETLRVKRQYTKQCPGAGCGIHIQKEEGCMEVECANKNCRVLFCWECKIILSRQLGYDHRTRISHLASCKAKYVREKRKKDKKLCKSVEKPQPGDADFENYREGWDVDEGFIGTGKEY